MRKWLIVVMLALLPLQFSWAALATFCAHEAGPAAQHPGHHEHQHLNAPAAEPGSTPTGQELPAGFDFDCGHCHAGCASLPASARTFAALSSGSRPAPRAERNVGTLAQSPPERPQWRRLA